MKGVWLAVCVVGVASCVCVVGVASCVCCVCVCVTVNPQLSDPLNSSFPRKLKYSQYGNEY